MKKFVLMFSLVITGLLVKAQTLPGISYSSWIGNTFGGKNSSTGFPNSSDALDKWVQDFIDSMSVTEDGTCYTASGWDEAGRSFGVYKNGDVLGNEEIPFNSSIAGIYSIVGKTISGTNGQIITNAGKPVAIAMGRGIYAGKLLVADNGQRKQILIYDVSSTPVIVEKLGVAGGIAADFTPEYEFPAAINAPAYPVKDYPPGNYHPLKLWGLTGVGCDTSGRIFVSTSEQGSAIRCFKKVSNRWILDWRVENYFFVDNIAYDENTDAVDIYAAQEHFKMDFSKTTAGREWSIEDYTLDAYNYPEDPRGVPEIKAGGEHMLTSVETREINGTRYLWTHGMTCQPPVIYKFKPNSEIAVPCGMFFGRSHIIYDLPLTFWWAPNRPSTDIDETLFWSDLNDDGKYQANEYASLKNYFDGGDFYIDKSGALWQGANPIKIWKPTFKANGNLVYKDANVEEVTINGVDAIGKLKFQEEYDRLVILTTACRDIDGGKMYIIDNWSKGNRTARYVADLKGPHQSGWTVAGDYAFEVGWGTRATVWVTDLNTGKLVGTMVPDASCGGLDRTGWVDISSGIKAYKRTSTGEYLVFVEDDFLGRVVMYRWCLGGDCLNGGAVKGLQIGPDSSVIKVGASIQLTRTFTPINPNNINITWSSSDNAVATVDSNGLVTGVSAGVAEITAISEDGGYSSKVQITVQPKFQVAHVQGPMFIDGKFDESEWKVDSLINKPVFGVQNNTGRFNLLWDEDYLYVAAAVKDAQVLYSPDNNPWENDAIEVYLDGNDNKGTLYDSADIQIIQQAGNAPVWTSRDASGISKAVAINDSGYSMEMAIPWSVLKTTVAAGSSVGFDIAYDDNDNGSRDGSTTWYGDGDNYANTAKFDDMILLAGTSSNITVTGLALDSSTLSLFISQTQQITATIIPINATNKKVVWSSSNTAIATVDSNGIVKGISAGVAMITATTVDGGLTASCSVTVSTLPIGTWTIADDKDPAWVWSGFDYDACDGCLDGSAHSTEVVNSTASYTFYGTDVKAFCETWDGAGSVDIFIDDVLKGSFSQRLEPYGGQQKFASFSGLTNGSHTIKFVATGSDWVGIDYIAFSQQLWIIADDKDPGWVWSGYDYDGCGTCYDGSAHSTDVINSFATYTLTGTDVEAYCETWDGGGSVDIYIDGVLQGSFSQRIEPYGGAQKFATISGLTNGSHTIKFVSTSTDWTGIDYLHFRSSGTLPLHLISFTAQLNSGKTYVKWKTENELNVQYFEIERSSDGINFSKIKTVNSKGSSTYQTIDEHPLAGNNYYRLKIVDKDGKYSRSNTVLVRVLNDNISLVSIYPNPAKDMLNITAPAANAAVKVTIFDQQGRKVMAKEIVGNTAISIANLAKGIYMLQLMYNGEIKAVKLVKE